MYLVINKCETAVKVSNFSGQYIRNLSTLDISVLGYIGIVRHKKHSPEVLSIPPGTLCIYILTCRSQWPRGLRRSSSAARLLRLWVRIPPWAWMFVCCECCVLSGRGLCDGLITRSEESYRLWRVVVCDHETSKTRRLKPVTGLWKYNHSGL